MDIPGLDKKAYLEKLWGPASNSWQRTKFQLRYLDRPYKPKIFDYDDYTK